jgi:outer membrane receptor protein involved in Fe transport
MSLIAIVVVASWRFGIPETEEVTQQATETSFETPAEELPTLASDASPDASVHAHASGTFTKSAPNIKLLPLAQQQEIKRLSGRDNPDSNIVEVQPGVFLMTDGPKVVPVAIMNADGSVTVHEY